MSGPRVVGSWCAGCGDVGGGAWFGTGSRRARPLAGMRLGHASGWGTGWVAERSGRGSDTGLVTGLVGAPSGLRRGSVRWVGCGGRLWWFGTVLVLWKSHHVLLRGHASGVARGSGRPGVVGPIGTPGRRPDGGTAPRFAGVAPVGAYGAALSGGAGSDGGGGRGEAGQSRGTGRGDRAAPASTGTRPGHRPTRHRDPPRRLTPDSTARSRRVNAAFDHCARPCGLLNRGLPIQGQVVPGYRARERRS